MNTQRFEESNQLLLYIQSLDYQNDADFCCLCGSFLLRQNQPVAAMGEFVRALYAKNATNKDATHNIPLYNIGLINERLGDTAEALVNYKMCVNFPMAEERIRLLEPQS
jgi:Tfp pilus assembly protein PilF